MRCTVVVFGFFFPETADFSEQQRSPRSNLTNYAQHKARKALDPDMGFFSKK